MFNKGQRVIGPSNIGTMFTNIETKSSEGMVEAMNEMRMMDKHYIPYAVKFTAEGDG